MQKLLCFFTKPNLLLLSDFILLILFENASWNAHLPYLWYLFWNNIVLWRERPLSQKVLLPQAMLFQSRRYFMKVVPCSIGWKTVLLPQRHVVVLHEEGEQWSETAER